MFTDLFILLVNCEGSFPFRANNAVSKIVVIFASHVDTRRIDNISENLFRV